MTAVHFMMSIFIFNELLLAWYLMPRFTRSLSAHDVNRRITAVGE